MNVQWITSNKKIVTLISVAIGCALLATIFYAIPTYSRIGGILDDIDDQRAALQAFEEPSTTSDAQEDEIRQRLDEVNSILIKREEALEFITHFEQVAASVGVKATLNLQEIDEKATGIQEVPVQITVQSSFSSLIQFLQDLDTEPTYIDITTLSLAPVSANGEQTVKASFAAKTFWD